MEKYKNLLHNKKVLCFLLFLTGIMLYPGVLEAQTRLEDIENKEVVEIIKQNYQDPTSVAVDLLVEESYKFLDDNRVIYKRHVLTKILSEGGRSLGTFSIPFNGYFEKLKVNIARTIQPDGRVMEVSPEAISEESPYSHLPVYSDYKIKKITFPGVQTGSVIEAEVEYDIDYKSLPSLSGMFYVPVNAKILLARFSLDVPTNKEVKFNAVRIFEKEPKTASMGDRTVYTWEVRNNKVWLEEPFLPSYMKFGNYISFSTIKSWEDVYQGYMKLMEDQAEPDENIDAKVKELTAGIPWKKTEIVKRLYNYVSQAVRYVAIELGMSAYKPYPAPEVLRNNYGDCKGKGALFIAMLKSAGIPAHFALVRTVNHGFLEPELPTIFFNHAIVAIPEGGDYTFVDPTADMLPYDVLPYQVQGAEALVLGDNGPEFVQIPVGPAERNKSYYEVQTQIEHDGSMEMNSKAEYGGQIEWLRRMERKYNNWVGYERNIKQGLDLVIPNAVLKSLKTSEVNNFDEPFTMTMKVSAAEYAKKSGDLLLFKIPLSFDSFLSFATTLERRETALFLQFPYGWDRKTTINFPVQYAVKYVPESLTFDTPALFYDAKFETKGHTISIHEKLVVKQREVGIGQYPRFKTMVGKIRKLYDENVILEKRP